MAARWGSFLQQAVTGIEARLDNILAEEEAKTAAQSPGTTSATPTASAAASSTNQPAPPKSPALTRSGSSSRSQDRLQERLARAVAAKNAAAAAGQKPEPSPSRLSFTTSPRQSLEAPSRTSTDGSVDLAGHTTQGTTSQRTSQDLHKRPSLDSTDGIPTTGARPLQGGDGDVPKEIDETGKETPRRSTDAASPPPQLEITPAAVDALSTEAQAELSVAPLTSTLAQPETTPDAAQAQQPPPQQEDIRDYVERVDALQAKLQYLAREAAEAAKKATQEAPAGSLEKKLAEKDLQIALLMEEGKNLGVTEQKHRAIMKKLRAKIAEDEKEKNELRAARAKADADVEMLRRRGRRADDLEKFHEESLKRIGLLQKEINNLRSESASKDATIADLKSQLQKAAEDAEAMTAKLNDQALEKERQKCRDLEDQVAALQVEKTLVADRARTQANDLREKAERAAERTRVVEVEMKAELQAMETKLEAMRARAEETSSGALGDSQAKLLRQVETLQTQYAVASDNWQGIESTLLARITRLEKERDEALQRESDMRKKAREAAVRARHQEEELEETRSRLPSVQADLKTHQTQLETLRKRAEQAEATLQEVKDDFEKQRAAWKEERQTADRARDRSESRDRRGWLEDMASHSLRGTNSGSRPESPLMAPPPRTWSADLLGFPTAPGKLRKASAPSSNGDAGDRAAALQGRRPSAQPSLHRPPLPSGSLREHHLHAAAPPTPFSQSSDSLPAAILAVQSPTAMTDHHAAGGAEDPLEAVETGSSHQVMQDMVSVSTVAAGPSVQLVERMSAQIRRLESEKVAGREELARMSRQRDEARAEIVALMREVESGKAAIERATRLEAQVAEVKDRYETTLEMLGEKSELVEELKADVQDVKAMYRDLIERTLK